jgi:threonylcarbamoyladenosine tRNA methylthiotransferase MtaB
MKYSVITFGCRVNQADSLGFEEEFLARGARSTSPDEADVVVVNTCSVTASADQAARQAIRRVSRMNPDAQIVVTGCYATRRPDEIAHLPNVVRVVPNTDKPQLVSFVRSVRLSPDTCDDVREVRLQPDRSEDDLSTAERFGDGDGSCGASISPGVAGRTAFMLRVQTGCAEPCSYCIIPSTRGGPISTPPDRVLVEVERVASAGFKEIALTGVHLGSYGRDLTPPSSLIELLRALEDLCQRGRSKDRSHLVFRISSLEPMDCTPEIVDLVAASACFAPHFHLPLQHASNGMLSAMRRPYTIEYYRKLTSGIRERMPSASIGSDVIVGFPGETEQDFGQLASYLEDSPLTHLHVFPYSDRPGTAATQLSDKVHGAIVRERSRRLREISARLSKRFRESQIGTVHRALTIEDGSIAVTGNYLKLKIDSALPRNDWITVRVSENGGSVIEK